MWFGGMAFDALVLVAAIGMATEWAAITAPSRARWSLPVLLAVLVIACGCAALGRTPFGWAALGVGLIALLAATRPGLFAWGVPYIGAAVVALIWLRADPQVGRGNLLGLIILIWASDIGAYIVGRLVGGPRLAPSISPGKTWSGAIGGLIAAAAVGAIAALWDGSGSSVIKAAGIAGCLGIVSQLGDLLESKLKRHFGVKDSGHIIPGHGGLLDRLDAVLIAAPVAAALAWMAGPGVSLWR